jgi:cytochrome c-type biogenesis protein
MTPTLPLAFVAGLLSFLSPCVLPLVPSYLAYIGGGAARRGVVMRSSLCFVLGFSLIFIGLGASASLLGGLLSAYRRELTLVGGLLILFFGVTMLGVRLPFLQRDARVRFSGETRTPAGAVLLGMAFAAGWTPCIGPVLGAALTLAGTSGQLSQGVTLLAAYALGLAVPFVLAAAMLESFTHFSKGLRRYLPWVERASGAILIVAGTLLLTGTYTALSGTLIRYTPDWLWSRL